jgi:hypothetical protein
MREARGRVQIAVIGQTVYAVGGSNGELSIFSFMLKRLIFAFVCRNN